MIKSLAELFGYLNIAVFAVVLFRHDVIERPNVIGYASLALSLLAALPYYLAHDRDARKTGWFGFMLCLCLIAIGHNFNALVARDERRPTEVLSTRRSTNHSESWRVQIDHGKVIDLHVYSVPEDAAVELRLRKGMFGVYFGRFERVGPGA